VEPLKEQELALIQTVTRILDNQLDQLSEHQQAHSQELVMELTHKGQFLVP